MPDKRRYQENKDYYKVYNLEYQMKNRDRINQQKREYYEKNKENIKKRNSKYYHLIGKEKRDPEKARISNRKSSNKRKMKLFDILGGMKCIKCGINDIRVLHIDHINNDGANDRKRFSSTNVMFCYYVNHPEECRRKLQVLCANCNWIKRYD